MEAARAIAAGALASVTLASATLGCAGRAPRARVGLRCADPGAEVTVEGVVATVAADGTFRAELPEADRAQVRVALRDAAGRVQERTIDCRTRPRIRGLGIDWGDE
jgi:hypothetical protein